MNKLGFLRDQKNLLQKDLAQIFNVAQNTISSWESGRNEIDIENLIKIADYFNVSIDYLLCRTNVPTNTFKDTPISEKQKKLINMSLELNENFMSQLIGYAEALLIQQRMGVVRPK